MDENDIYAIKYKNKGENVEKWKIKTFSHNNSEMQGLYVLITLLKYGKGMENLSICTIMLDNNKLTMLVLSKSEPLN